MDVLFLLVSVAYPVLTIRAGWRAGCVRGHSLDAFFPEDSWISWAGLILLALLAAVQGFRLLRSRAYLRRLARSVTLIAILVCLVLGVGIPDWVRQKGWNRWVASLDLETVRRDCKGLVDAKPSGALALCQRGTPQYEALPASLRALQPRAVQVLQDNLVDLDFGGSETAGRDGLLVSPYGFAGKTSRFFLKRRIAPDVVYYWCR